MNSINKVYLPSDDLIFDVLNQILSFNDEYQLDEYIKKEEFFDKYCSWKPVGGEDTNFRWMLNQQSDPITALCEPIVNSIDQLLILGCLREALDPQDIGNPKLPKTMQEAAQRYFSVPNGTLKSMSKNERMKLAENIKITILPSQKKGEVNIFIYDKATGQNPGDFKNTFLQHSRSMKIKIPFTQGKYAMGGAGPIAFCGYNKYALILSRIHPEIVSSEEKKHRKWGFTIIRKNRSNSNDKVSYFEFLCDKRDSPNHNVFSFSAEKIPNSLPEPIEVQANGMTTAKLTQDMDKGTLIKYFNYQTRGAEAAGTMQRKLNIRLWDPVLPFMIYDGRTKSRGSKFYVHGGECKYFNSQLLHDKYIKGIEFSFTTKHNVLKDTIEVTFKGRVIVFKQYSTKNGKLNSTTKRLARDFAGIKGVLTHNGQAHATLTRQFFSRFKLKSLKNFMFVIIDFRDIFQNYPDLNNEYFMGNREQMKTSPFTEEFRKELRKALETNTDLIELNREYQEAENKLISSDETLQKELFNLIKKENPEIIELFSGKDVEFHGLLHSINKIESEIGEGEKKEKKIRDVVDDPSQLLEVEKNILEEKPTGLQFASTNESKIKRYVKVGQERIFVRCRTEYSLDEIQVKSTQKNEWKKTSAKFLANNLLQIHLFPPGDEKEGDVKIIKIRKKKDNDEVDAKRVQNVARKSKSTSSKKWHAYTMDNFISSVEKKEGISSDRTEQLIEEESSKKSGEGELTLILQFRKREIKNEVKKNKSPELSAQLPILEPLNKSSEQWKIYGWNENLIGSRTEAGDVIYINTENNDFIKKLNQINPNDKDKFKMDYLNSIYLCILYDSIKDPSNNENFSNLGDSEEAIDLKEIISKKVYPHQKTFLTMWKA